MDEIANLASDEGSSLENLIIYFHMIKDELFLEKLWVMFFLARRAKKWF